METFTGGGLDQRDKKLAIVTLSYLPHALIVAQRHKCTQSITACELAEERICIFIRQSILFEMDVLSYCFVVFQLEVASATTTRHHYQRVGFILEPAKQ
ncbi:hypothetical protein DOE76_04205 [Leifsonia sp. ku-ls]|nr:hypothetical protein DOE76_04205 [Leifsonia sp. ku-ls]